METNGTETGRSELLPGYQRDWPQYFAAVTDLGPRETLLRALQEFAAADNLGAGTAGRPSRLAVDLGCGEGRDTRALLADRGSYWRVIALDGTAEGIARLGAKLTDHERPRVQAMVMKFEDVAGSLVLPGAASVDLVNASFALPFCKPEAFMDLWVWIGRVLKPGGRFAGQLFGDRDEWRKYRPQSHWTRAEADELLRGYAVEMMDEVEKEGTDATGGQKHHHIFHIVARKV